MIDSLIGGIYTLVIIAISGFVGYLIGSKEFKKLVEERIESKKHQFVKSGPVKAIPPSQLNDKDLDTKKRLEELGL